MAEHRSTAAAVDTPLWVRVFGALAAALAAFVLVAIITGGGGMHGPTRHAAGSGTELGLLALLTVLLGAAVALNGFMPAGRGRTRPARRVMPPRLRKLALVCHVVASVGFLGAVTCFFVLALTGLRLDDTQAVHAVYVAMAPLTRIVIVPLCIATLLTGLLQALGTPWGLLQHYWVLVKLLLTLVTAIVLLLQVGQISAIAETARQTASSLSDLWHQRVSLITHAGGGLVVLLTTTVLSIFKPPGLTPLGTRSAGV